MTVRYPAAVLEDFAARIFNAGGLARDRARIVARGFLEADLLGFSTHGLARVPANLRWLETGASRARGDPQIRVDRAAVANWDAAYLPGPYVMHLAVQHALDKVANAGTFTMTLSRCQHIACLASYLPPIIERDCVAVLMASSPGESFVSPYLGREPVFSNNPLAFCAPAADGPVLFDVSMAITAGGQVDRAVKEGIRMPEACLKDHAGNVTDNPRVLRDSPPGSIMALGGSGHGHKGHALTVMTEVLTQAVAGYGRARNPPPSEENSVFLQVIDPTAFTPRSGYLQEINYLVDRVTRSTPDSPGTPVRMPGARAWRARKERLESGVDLYPGILEALEAEAVQLGVAVPDWDRLIP